MLTKQSALGRGKRFNSNDDEGRGGREDGAKSRSGGGARNVFILIMVSKILAAAAPPLPLLVDVFWKTVGGGYLFNIQWSITP